MNQDSAVNLYNRRAKSIINNNLIPGAGPSSGQGVMLNDTSEKYLKNNENNEVVFHGAAATTPTD